MTEKNKTLIKKVAQITLIALINIFIITFIATNSASALSKMGSRGEEVKKIQTRLKEWGYYNGKVDGIYGTNTKNAVIKFQKKNKLTADGIAGKKTLTAIGIASTSTSTSNPEKSSSDYNLLARVISAEARGEPYSGQIAVGAVILNRVQHPSFPDTIAGVVYQKGAFTCMDDGQFNVAVADSAYKAAQDSLNGMDPSGGAIYYYNPKTSTNKWILSRPQIVFIGKHKFCS